MLRIGLTGGSGCGKSTAARMFASYGAKIVDADAVYHSLVSTPSPCVSDLAHEFGEEILSPGGGLDRKKLAGVVFADSPEAKASLARLNEITHRYVRLECERLIDSYEQSGEAMVVLDVPLLFESGFDRICDVTVAVLASRPVRVARIMARDRIDQAAAEARITSQPNDDFYKERAKFLLINDGEIEELRSQVLAVLERSV